MEREKWEKRSWSTITEEEKEKYIKDIPVIIRSDEKYICPEEYGWERRYYRRLLNISKEEEIKGVCKNYLEGLEWVLKYYTVECKDWRWRYEKSYPPLLSDIEKNITKEKIVIVENKNAFSEYVQLAYVLPYSQLNLLPKEICEELKTKYAHLYKKENRYGKWVYKRYIWESNANLPYISLNEMYKGKM